jgi:hypothetical protein
MRVCVSRYWKPSQRIEQDHLIIGNGIYSILNQLYHTLLDPSEAVLISSPYYSGFDAMINKRVQGLVVGVPLEERSDGILEEGDVEARFGQALKRCREGGLHVRRRVHCRELQRLLSEIGMLSLLGASYNAVQSTQSDRQNT